MQCVLATTMGAPTCFVDTPLDVERKESEWAVRIAKVHPS